MKEILENGVLWDHARGIGYYPAKSENVYDSAYFEKYRAYEKTEMGKRLLDFRLSLVQSFVRGLPLVDVGIGCGTFVEKRGDDTFGYDVNPFGVQWLAERGIWWDPWFRRMPSASFWDSLEHVDNMEDLIRRIDGFAFVSIPIFSGPDHVARSKHFRPDEHFWYFTRTGLLETFLGAGFRVVEESSEESKIGREDIETFVFARHV